ncbi:hypothetical protein [Nubsella zeaxanthinifaciens]|uniref:hypothetical protein n=1 Tax=Nubsella zeaxanthinifaciens TaxID=392412 RepID=UPI000DE4D32F|nr:hypothetical protein [Nubsella zeaxanthinifaciens]
MEIKYLSYLKDNPVEKGVTRDWKNQPIPLTEIEQLEALYNNNTPFPKALRELLFLTGNSCYLLDFAIFNQQQMQEHVRKYLNYGNKTITRPFYAIDVYHASDQMLFVYLDQGDDPIVWNALYEYPIDKWLEPTGLKISEFITSRINSVKKGMNPF